MSELGSQILLLILGLGVCMALIMFTIVFWPDWVEMWKRRRRQKELSNIRVPNPENEW